jgi:hypothetical protein
VLLSGLLRDATAAQSGDTIDGAIWQFEMTPKGRGLKPLRGRFRVSDNVLYQNSQGMRNKFDKVIGKNHPDGRRTRVEFEDFRAADKDRNFQGGMKGTARLKIDRVGEWSGVFTDGEGRNWDFKCTRVRE